ncbi:MAG: hypothetical protein WB504_13995, partial [Pseudolabrys sp.]
KRVSAPHMSVFRGKADMNLLRCKCLLLTQSGIPDPRWPLLKSGLVHFDDGLCITETSVIESVHDFSLGYTA